MSTSPTGPRPAAAPRLVSNPAPSQPSGRPSLAMLRQVGWKTVGTTIGDNATKADITGRAAQLAYYFFFSLFPGLIAASALLGVTLKSANQLSEQMLGYLATVIPQSAFQIVSDTFHQTTHASTGTKLILGSLTALWSASAGTSALQDALNAVYSLEEKRPMWRARLEAVVLTLVVGLLLILTLLVLFFGDKIVAHYHAGLGYVLVVGVRIISWPIAFALLAVGFALLYWKAPDKRDEPWQWVTPGAVVGILLWLVASLALRVYLHYFDSYSVTYGSLGAVIVLLTWFYLSGLAVLLGAVINNTLEDLGGRGGEQKQGGARNQGLGHTSAARTSA